MSVSILQGDARAMLATLPDESVHCCVTSPPYWGLRDYGHPDQMGLEPTPEAFIAGMVGVFAEVRRVLREDGTLWLNMGDGYCAPNGRSSGGTCGRGPNSQLSHMHNGQEVGVVRDFGRAKPKDLMGMPWRLAFALQADGWYLRSDIIWHKPNPMPESVTDRPTKAHEYVFLLTKSARYFYDAAAVAERCTYPDDTRPANGSLAPGQRPGSGKRAGANSRIHVTRTPNGAPPQNRRMPPIGGIKAVGENGNGNPTYSGNTPEFRETRNARSVWTIPTQGYSGAHFATFPEELAARCIKAGCPGPGKRCRCDEIIKTPLGTGGSDDPTIRTGRAGFNRPRRNDEGTRPITRREQLSYAEQIKKSPHRDEMATAAGTAFAHYIRTDESGARPIPPDLLQRWLTCGWLHEPEPCNHPVEPGGTVLDPFGGSGTTAEVALKLGRKAVLIELNPEYVKLIRARLHDECPLLAGDAA